MRADNEYQKMNLIELQAEKVAAVAKIQGILMELGVAKKHLRWMNVFIKDNLKETNKCGSCKHFTVESCNQPTIGHIARRDYDLACKLYEE